MKEILNEEIQWLDLAASATNFNNSSIRWEKFHSSQLETAPVPLKTLTGIFPLHKDVSNTYEMMCHTMNISM